jgi:protein O-GlcNAc transferase
MEMRKSIRSADTQPSRLTIEKLQQAIFSHQSGWFIDAAKLYGEVLSVWPTSFDALHLLGVLEAQNGNMVEAERLVGAALKAGPANAEAFSNYARILRTLGRRDDALVWLERALEINPRLVIALANRGALSREMGRPREALAYAERALAISPQFRDAKLNRGNALLELGRAEDALAAFEVMAAENPADIDARLGRAHALNSLCRWQDALAEIDRIIAVEPRNPLALNSRGVLLRALDREQEAYEAFNAAIIADPNLAQTYATRGSLLLKLKRYEQAAADFVSALRLDPESQFALGNVIHCRMMVCQWEDFQKSSSALHKEVGAGKPVTPMFYLLSLSASEEEISAYARSLANGQSFPAPTVWHRKHERIRVAYLSADFHNHPTSFLTAGLYEQHDRDAFEIFGVSLSKPHSVPMVDRLQSTFDDFIDVHALSDTDAVTALRKLEVDIAVDLMGHTANSRMGIFARHCAPIKVSWLGYPGTLGTDYMDYILADRIVIPERDQVHYSERVVYLPDTFHVTDDRRPIVKSRDRGECGLPEGTTVFCSFNNSYKINPTMFDVWMRVLGQVPDSILWLLESGPSAVGNLRAEASRRGVDPSRLMFSGRAEYEDYLANYTAADLFLDTLPFNGGATVSDALWAGLPVLACVGSTFVGRMAASLLTAAGLSELITPSLQEYEALAVSLGRDQGRLRQLRATLTDRRSRSALFDTHRFARHLESAYVTMWERHLRGEPAASFAVPPVGEPEA